MERIKPLLNFFRQVWDVWNEVKLERMAAALAYYGTFATVPLLYVALTVGGLLLDDRLLSTTLLDWLTVNLGRETADFISSMLIAMAQRQTQSSILFWIIGLLILFYVASGLFVNLEDMVNMIWRNPYPVEQGIVPMLRYRLVAFVMVLAVGAGFVVLTLTNFVLSLARNLVPAESVLWANHIVTFGATVVAVGLVYRLLGRLKPPWRAIWIGAVVATTLFTIGKVLFGLYLQLSNVTTAFAAASTLAVLLLSIYFTALIFLVGAMAVRVASERMTKVS